MTPATADNRSHTVAQLFRILDAWRHLPGYRLEGRLAPFFELFLHEVLGVCLNDELHPVIIPEFPLRKGTLDSDDDSNQSYNVDYVAFSKDREKVFLVELKTDMGSRRDEQDQYLLDASQKRFRDFVLGAMQLARASKHKPKYLHLMHLLCNLELVSIKNDTTVYQLTYPKPRPGWNKAFDGVQLDDGWNKRETTSRVVYIQPECKRDDPVHGTRYIGFAEVANIVHARGALGYLFANYLRQWTCPPGGRDPRDIVHTR